MRTSASPDGKACTYSTPDGAEVTLQLVSVPGAGVDSALSNIETTLLANREAPKPGEAAEASGKDAAKTTASAAKAEAEAHGDAKGGSSRELFFMISTGVLAVLLVITSITKRKPLDETTDQA